MASNNEDEPRSGLPDSQGRFLQGCFRDVEVKWGNLKVSESLFQIAGVEIRVKRFISCSVSGRVTEKHHHIRNEEEQLVER